MGKDNIFDKPTERVNDFKFDEKVVSVFDDMVSRSVPFYHEIQRMMGELAADFATDGSNVYDLGSSTGATLVSLDKALGKGIKFIGVDNSPEMIEQCRSNLKAAGISHECELVAADLNQGIMLDNASVVVMCLTLQFIRPLNRERLIGEIYRQLNPNGCLILVEKVVGESSLFNRLFIKNYYEMKKRNHYSELEISKKREALENVLIPYKLFENLELLQRSGFRHNDVFFKWYNFCGLIAIK
jgi:tRNA (cmo5U34)-methyltransferase